MTKDFSKKLTIVIVTFNSESVIEKCLSNLDSSLYDIIVVDNKSKDKTAEIVEKKFPKVELIKQKINSGFNRGNNVGLKKAKTEFCLVLNPDAFIAPQGIESVLDFMQKNPDVAISGVNLARFPGDLEYLNYMKKTHFIADSAEENVFFVDFVVGACFFFRKKFFEEFGYLDDDLFLFGDDNEICLRAVRNNQKIALLDDVEVIHVCGSSSGEAVKKQVSRIRTWHMTWSKLYFKQKKSGSYKAKRLAIILIIRYFCKILVLQNPKENYFKLNAAACFLVGIGAFKSDGNPRI